MAGKHLDKVDLSLKWNDEKDYEERLKALQNRARNLQTACYHNGARIVIVLEGWDASGKGGVIRRLTARLDPRSCRVHPIGAPDQREQSQHYLQRFWEKLPGKGHIAIFDRSWYGRVLVERVADFASEPEWRRAYDEINLFEKTLTDDGVVVFKVLLHISQDEQLHRYLERLNNPRKHWKLTEEDLRNRQQADAYREAYEEMLERTDRANAPWCIIPGEHKWFARTSAIESICRYIESRIDTRIPQFSKSEIEETKTRLGVKNS